MSLVTSLCTHCRRLGMLLRRELWEHRGMLLWVPLIVGGISMLPMLFEVMVFGVKFVSGELHINDMPMEQMPEPAHYDVQTLQRMAIEQNQGLVMMAALVFVTLALTVSFYCLGALYNDRRDHSVLFWKSLPVSDVETVLSKVLIATVVAPAVAMFVVLGMMVVHLLMQAVVIAPQGGERLWLLWQTANPFQIVLAQLAAIPVYALWTLPVIGWLLMCSAFSSSKPFLWAVTVPGLIGLLASWLQSFGIIDFNLWEEGFDHVLSPFSHLFPPLVQGLQDDLWFWDNTLIDPTDLWRGLAQARVWIGAGVGTAMIAAALALRRWREVV